MNALRLCRSCAIAHLSLLAALLALAAAPCSVQAQLGNIDATVTGSPVVRIGTVTAGTAASPAQVTVTLSSSSTDPVTVQYATRDASAVAGRDYDATTGTLTFAPGITTQTVQINVLTGAGANLYCWLDLSNAVNASVDPIGSAQISINPTTTTDSVTVQFSSASYTVSASAGQATITVTVNGTAAGAVSVSYSTSDGTAVAGKDYSAASGTLHFTAGQTAQSFAVAIADTKTYGGNKGLNWVQLLLLQTPRKHGAFQD